MPQVYLEKSKANEKQNLHVETVGLVEDQRKIEYGFCKCGCGKKTKLAKRTRKYLNLIKGEPINFILGHNTPKGKNSPCWKGKKIGYVSLHRRLYISLGKPNFCSDCGTTKAKRFEWANISKKYKYSLKDFKRLCTSCHRKFDKSRVGEKCNFSKLKEKDIINIRKFYKTGGYSRRNLAKKFKVTKENIEKIVNYKSWKHI